MAFDNMDMDSEEDLGVEDITPPETPSNRPFFVVAGILGAITLLAVACIAAYALWYLPQQNRKEAAQLEEINAQNTAIAESLIQTQVASAYTETPTPTEVVVEPTATSTPVVVEATEVVATAAATQDPRTATVAALLTQAASAQQTSQATSAAVATSTALPTTGFADEVGIPGLFGMAVVLLVVIFLARRLRMAN
ncbi:MAG: hypothetical protein JW908_04155 [Anaerolineales bacterium]|nr:hypothetical protein [Anaerolineales bacterium]